MAKIFLTGGKGFIGRNFQDMFQARYHIDAPTRAELELTNQKAVDAYFANKHYDCIVNGVSVAVNRGNSWDPERAFAANIQSFLTTYKQRHLVNRYLQLGSGAEYGRPLATRQIHESQLGLQIPSDHYGLAKLQNSQMVLSSAPDNNAIVLHLFGVFGPYEDYQTRFISNAIVHTLAKRPIVINQNVEFDYVYIKDCLRIIELFMHKNVIHPNYNVTTGHPITLEELAFIVRDVIGNCSEIIIKNPSMGSSYTGDNQRLLDFLGGDFQFTPFKQAISELVSWYEMQFRDNMIVKELLA